jgi:hypothetical protein
MMGITADGQAYPALVRTRAQRFGIDNDDKKADRADIQAPSIDPRANAWQHGGTIQIPDPAGAERTSCSGIPVAVAIVLTVRGSLRRAKIWSTPPLDSSSIPPATEPIVCVTR